MEREDVERQEAALLGMALRFVHELSERLGDRTAAVELVMRAAREVLLGLNLAPHGSRPLSLALTHLEEGLWRVKESQGKVTF